MARYHQGILPRHQRRKRMCRQKIPHPTREGAQTHAEELIKKRPGHEFEPYVCIWCEYWHVGHKMTGYRNPSNSGLREIALQIELGDRVLSQLLAENYGSREKRIAAIVQRLKRFLLKNGIYCTTSIPRENAA